MLQPSASPLLKLLVEPMNTSALAATGSQAHADNATTLKQPIEEDCIDNSCLATQTARPDTTCDPSTYHRLFARANRRFKTA